MRGPPEFPLLRLKQVEAEMKALIALIFLAGCASQSIHQDPYAVNHRAPTVNATAVQACDEVVPHCQAGDSYINPNRLPAASGACTQEVSECETMTVHCKDEKGADSTTQTLDYVKHQKACRKPAAVDGDPCDNFQDESCVEGSVTNESDTTSNGVSYHEFDRCDRMPHTCDDHGSQKDKSVLEVIHHKEINGD